MRHSRFYYNDIYLGTLYENGKFDYTVSSNLGEELDIEMVVHNLERIRRTGLEKDFNFDRYIQSYQNSFFKDGFEFK